MSGVIDFYEFAKNYVKIVDGNGNDSSFNEEQLKELKEMQDMIDKGYVLKVFYLRRGSALYWAKKV